MPTVVYKVSFRVSLMREDSPEVEGEVTSLSGGVCFVVSDGQVRDGDFVYDNGQILLELLAGREEEKRRRFVAGLRRLTRANRPRLTLEAPLHHPWPGKLTGIPSPEEGLHR